MRIENQLWVYVHQNYHHPYQYHQVHYQGACGSCPSSLTGTLSGIQYLVQRIDPNLEVVAV